MLVKYESGEKESISSALKNGTITMNDLDKNNISYLKSPKEKKEEHAFFGRVVESHSSYIIVMPNENEEERKSCDKFLVQLDKNSDQIYQVGTNVKITYSGMIYERYPAQIGTTKIEIKSIDSFNLIFHPEPGKGKKQIIEKTTNKKYDYDVYICDGTMEIVLDNKTYLLEDALKENKITLDEIIKKANQDFPNAPTYDDGGSIEYHYANYTILKLHTLIGNRNVYFGNENLKIKDIK